MCRHVIGILCLAIGIRVTAVQDSRKRHGIVVFVIANFLLLDIVVVLDKPVERHQVGLVPQAVHELSHVIGRGIALTQESRHHLSHAADDGTIADFNALNQESQWVEEKI